MRSRQHIWGNCQADLFGSFQVNHELEFSRLFHGRSAGLASFKILSTNAAARRNNSSSFAACCASLAYSFCCVLRTKVHPRKSRRGSAVDETRAHFPGSTFTKPNISKFRVVGLKK